MNEERQMILEMLKDGKINVEEASELLDAVGKDKNTKNEDSFVNKLSQSLEKVIKKTSETISNIDFDAVTNPSNIYHINSVAVENQTRIDDEVKEIEVDIVSGSLEIERAQDNYILVNQTVFFKEKTAEITDYLLVEAKDEKLSIRLNPKYENVQASAKLKLALSKNLYENLKIKNVNGEIEVADVDFSNSNIESVNSRIAVINSAGDLDIKNVNGKIEVKNTNGNLSISNTNGPAYLTNVSGQVAKINVVNGPVRVDGIRSEKLFANSKSGSIRVSRLEDISEISLDSSVGTIVLDTENYNGDISSTIKSNNHSISEKFKNKIQRPEGYEISTNPEKTDLRAYLSTNFGKVIIK